jgi:hypothetical protein
MAGVHSIEPVKQSSGLGFGSATRAWHCAVEPDDPTGELFPNRPRCRSDHTVDLNLAVDGGDDN